MCKAERQKDFFWGALLGGTVATLTALLFTTKKGKKLQDQIIDTYEEVEGAVKDTFAASKDKVEESVDQAEKKGAHKLKKEAHH